VQAVRVVPLKDSDAPLTAMLFSVFWPASVGWSIFLRNDFYQINSEI
jgi:hypothetical protein